MKLNNEQTEGHRLIGDVCMPLTSVNERGWVMDDSRVHYRFLYDYNIDRFNIRLLCTHAAEDMH